MVAAFRQCPITKRPGTSANAKQKGGIPMPAHGFDAEVPLALTDAVRQKTDALYEGVSHIIPRLEWDLHAPTIARINDLKRE